MGRGVSIRGPAQSITMRRSRQRKELKPVIFLVILREKKMKVFFCLLIRGAGRDTKCSHGAEKENLCVFMEYFCVMWMPGLGDVGGGGACQQAPFKKHYEMSCGACAQNTNVISHGRHFHREKRVQSNLKLCTRAEWAVWVESGGSRLFPCI